MAAACFVGSVGGGVVAHAATHSASKQAAANLELVMSGSLSVVLAVRLYATRFDRRKRPWAESLLGRDVHNRTLFVIPANAGIHLVSDGSPLPRG
jgi:hypothetical protein